MSSPSETRSDALVRNLASYNQSRNLTGKPFRSLCYAPHVQLSFYTDGSAAVCCMSRHQPIGNVARESLAEMWNGSRMQGFRKALQQDVLPRGCEQCKWELEMGNIGNHPMRGFDDLQVDPKVEWPTRLEFAMSNLCNLGCIHCFGELSSVIRSHEGLPAMPRVYGDKFFEELRPFLPHLRTSSFVGGEPFLQEECFRVWELLIEMGLKPQVSVTTNGTVFNDRVRRVLDHLPVCVSVSLDSINPRTFERIRLNARAASVMRNLELFRAHQLERMCGKVTDEQTIISLNFVLMRRNWRDLADGFLFAEERQCRVWVTPLVAPKHLSVFDLPSRTLNAMRDVLDRQTEAILPQLKRNRVQWLEMTKMVHKAAEDALSRERGVRNTVELGALGIDGPMQQAWAASARGDEKAAFDLAAKTPPESRYYSTSFVFRAELVLRKGQLAECEALLTEAARLGDQSGDLFLRRGWLRLRQDRLTECAQDLAKLAKLIAANASAQGYLRDGLLCLRANLAEREGDRAMALASMEELCRRHPEELGYQHDLQRLRTA